MCNVYQQSIFKDFCPCILWGTDKEGKRYPDRQSSTRDFNLVIREYRKLYPKVVHVNIDLALHYDHNS